MPHILPSILPEQYRPTCIEEFVLPDKHKLAAALKFLKEPSPSTWLLYGDSGLGKTSMALLMAKAAAQHPNAIMSVHGGDLDIPKAKKLKKVSKTGVMWGNIPTIIVNEAHCMPDEVADSLLGVTENPGYSVWIFTTTWSVKDFKSTFYSRLIPQHFTSQGICGPAAERLSEIAKLEGIELSAAGAEKLVRDAKNNIRFAIQTLHVLGAEQESPAFSTIASTMKAA